MDDGPSIWLVLVAIGLFTALLYTSGWGFHVGGFNDGRDSVCRQYLGPDAAYQDGHCVTRHVTPAHPVEVDR